MDLHAGVTDRITPGRTYHPDGSSRHAAVCAE
ncbi:hypothetical protein Ae168Ps1_5404 [Pseudonocardia sp. Ae168_Ps1]|nr:hypothetical protein Ae168Ps1_5404 [Pseudonocardia sp. Ae168_Ps1]OLL88341.1 hypothetical protein Ae263Ps1_5396 [Pseudonocardia sp. Ae263_Ps1]